jgi:hypothetical protein
MHASWLAQLVVRNGREPFFHSKTLCRLEDREPAFQLIVRDLLDRRSNRSGSRRRRDLVDPDVIPVVDQ